MYVGTDDMTRGRVTEGVTLAAEGPAAVRLPAACEIPRHDMSLSQLSNVSVDATLANTFVPLY